MAEPKRIVDQIENAIRRAYHLPHGLIPLHTPYFAGREWQYVKDCLDSGWVSSLGNFVNKFEWMACDFTGSGYAVATVNGTAAIHVSLLVGGVEAEDEVICPVFSFVATVSAIVYCKALPVFMDSDSSTLGLDAGKLSEFLRTRCIRKEDGFTYNKGTGRRIKACIVMHTYGYPVDLAPVLSLCADYNITLIEDAAEALGSYYHGQHCGTIGRLGILSFNGNKVVTTGGGGMILTDDRELAEKAKHLTTTAKVDHPWEYFHDEVGYNYRMPNLNAALGCAQMEHLRSFLAHKAEQAERVKEALRTLDGVRVIEPVTGIGNHWLNLVSIRPEYRNEVLKSLNERGIQARASWFPVCDMDPYHKFERFEIEVGLELYRSIICLPNGISR